VAFYQRCFAHVAAHPDLRQTLGEFRRAQLIKRGQEAGTLSPERAAALANEVDAPAASMSVEPALQAFSRGMVVFADNPWTLCEHESLILTLHAAMARSSI
jgi:hypothetical protein